MTPEERAAFGQMEGALMTIKRLAGSAGANPPTTNQRKDLIAAVTSLVAGRQTMRAIQSEDGYHTPADEQAYVTFMREASETVQAINDGEATAASVAEWVERSGKANRPAPAAGPVQWAPANSGWTNLASDLRASYDTPLSWGDEFIARRGGVLGSGMQAALLDPGTTPVTVPLAAQPITDARQARFVFQLSPSEDAPGGLFSYLRQTARVLNAAVVAPGASKPLSVFTLERVDDSTKVIAHVSEPINRFDLEDAPSLRQFINDEMLYGLQKALDARFVANVLAAATTGSATLNLAGIRGAITTLEQADMAPSGIVLNPSDWEDIEGEAVALNSVNSPSPNDALSRRLYSTAVVVSNTITAGTAIVGDFAGGGQIRRTGSASLTFHDSQPRDVGGTQIADFRLNQLVARSEMRAEGVVLRPAAFIQVGA